jgi:hypothetical protein
MMWRLEEKENNQNIKMMNGWVYQPKIQKVACFGTER